MSRLLIIGNPAAAKVRRAWPIVQRQLEASRIEFDFHETTQAGDATVQTRTALRSAYRTIAVLGGDGTLSEVAEGFFEICENLADAPSAINPSASLAVLPAGTGNDFARGLRGKRASLKEWTSTLIAFLQSKSQTRTVDLIYGRCNNYTRQFICLNASTLGIGGETGSRVAAQGKFMRQFSGETRFLVAAAIAVAAWRERRVLVSIDDYALAEGPMNLVAVANNVYAGAGMMLTPAARIDDGKLDVVIASGLTRLNVIRELPRLHSGGHVINPKVKTAQGTYAKVETFDRCDALPIEADGNVRGQTPADYIIMPAALNFVV